VVPATTAPLATRTVPAIFPGGAWAEIGVAGIAVSAAQAIRNAIRGFDI